MIYLIVIDGVDAVLLMAGNPNQLVLVRKFNEFFYI
jgi:hypothetical protein